MRTSLGKSGRWSQWRRRRDEAGYVAVIAAMLFGTVFIGMAAIGVDTAHWYQEAERVQKAADAAALAGVTYMPNDITKATSTAIAVATKNGYPNSGRSSISVTVGSKPSELKVTITMRVDNFFGKAIGVSQDYITRTATADFTAPAPMGSPCNTFGNEPRGSTGTSTVQPAGTALPSTTFSNCPKDATTGTSQPQFWGSIEGPETDKVQGDRYNTWNCAETGNAGATYGCASGKNSEYIQDGTFFVIHVEAGAANSPIDIQIYDPLFALQGSYCANSYNSQAQNPTTANLVPQANTFVNNMNPWTTDGLNRYGAWRDSSSNVTGGNVLNAGSKEFCTGDSYPTYTANKTWTGPVTTSFMLRDYTPTNDPRLATPINTAGCPITQFRGYANYANNTALRSTLNTYNQQYAQLYHQWYKLCTFTPSRAGDYYLQVRSNVTAPTTGAPGMTCPANTNNLTPIICTGNTNVMVSAGNTTSGGGSNSFGIRAIPNTDAKKKLVSVSGFEKMPLFQNSPASTATFNLVRALPNAKGQYLSFDFFDAADGSSGTVKILPPVDATGSVTNASGVPGCKSARDAAAYANITGCQVSVVGTSTDGHVMHMVVPIPNDYNCGTATPVTLGDCWFRVQMAYSGAVTDFTTWSATIGGDPVRLVH